MTEKFFKILKAISEIIAKNEDHQLVLDRIVDVLAQNIEVDVCSVYVYEEDENKLVLRTTHGLNQKAKNNVTISPNEGLTGKSFRSLEILNVGVPDQEKDFKYFDIIGEEAYSSFLAVPLTIGGKCVGVLTCQGKKSERFEMGVVDIVKSLSTQLANLILNTKMLKALADSPFAEHKKRSDNKQLMLRGIAANQGISFGKAFIFKNRNRFEEIEHKKHNGAKTELDLLNKALISARDETLKLEENALNLISEADASIFNVHLMLLEDKSLINAIRDEIIKEKHCLEYAIVEVFRQYKKRFSKLGDELFRERIMDLKDVLLRILAATETIRAGRKGEDFIKPVSDEKLILAAKELLPSDLVRMPIDKIAGIVCERGGVTAHVAILAKALDIPAIVGIKNLVEHINSMEMIILDAFAELIYINPTSNLIKNYETLIDTSTSNSDEDSSEPAKTSDGCEISIRANISLICETSLLSKYGAKGIGLYRTEFLYMIRDHLPSEDTQYNVFSKIMQDAEGENVTIRVLDSGADKPLPYLSFIKEDNPALGLRGVRFLLKKKEIFKPHLKAILRAGAEGNLKLLFPMVSSISEMTQLRQILSEVETELHAKGIAHSDNYKVGIMLEVPSMIFALKNIIDQVDFVSIGSNDLFQYIFASDRANEYTSDSFSILDPIFLRVLKQIGDFFNDYPDKTLTMCGEMCGIAHTTPLLLGCGIHDLSMSPKQIPGIKKIIRAFSIKDCRKILEAAVVLKNHESVLCLMKDEFQDRKIKI